MKDRRQSTGLSKQLNRSDFHWFVALGLLFGDRRVIGRANGWSVITSFSIGLSALHPKMTFFRSKSLPYSWTFVSEMEQNWCWVLRRLCRLLSKFVCLNAFLSMCFIEKILPNSRKVNIVNRSIKKKTNVCFWNYAKSQIRVRLRFFVLMSFLWFSDNRQTYFSQCTTLTNMRNYLENMTVWCNDRIYAFV